MSKRFFHPHERMGEPVRSVHDLRKEIAFDAVESAIDFGARIAMRRDDPPVLDRDHDAATGAAEAARGLIPFELEFFSSAMFCASARRGTLTAAAAAAAAAA